MNRRIELRIGVQSIVVAALAVLGSAACGNYTLSGSVDGDVQSGVKITLSGDADDSVTTDDAGAFSFEGLANGDYVLAPSRSGFTFSPATKSVTIAGDDVGGITFTATTSGPLHSISGKITGDATQGITVVLGGDADATTATSSNGEYEFADLADGDYTVSPTKSGFTFDPASASVTIAGADVSDIDFTSTATGDVIEVTDDITAPTTWTSDFVYLVNGPITVSSTLTIEAGTVVKLGDFGTLSVSGAIHAPGTATAPIVFTSAKDDSYGGDTNGDGGASDPAPGDWSGIMLMAGGSAFDHCAFLYAGALEMPAVGVYGEGVDVSVTDSIFAHHSAGDTISATAALYVGGSGSHIVGNTFFDDVVPFAMAEPFNLDDSNVFDNAGVAPSDPQPSRFNAVVIDGCGHVQSNVHWQVTKVPMVVGNPNDACNYLVVDGGASLTLDSGVMMKFFADGRMTVEGVLVTHVTNAAAPTVFTSIKDDAHGGDTNGDEDVSAPAGGDWQGVLVRANGSTVSHALFLYGGGGDASLLGVQSEISIHVDHSTFAYSIPPTNSLRAAPALDLLEAAAGTVVTSNVFYGNRVPLVIDTTFSLDDTNAFDNAAAAPGNPEPNQYNGVVIRGCGGYDGNVTLSQSHVPFVVGNAIDACNYITIQGGGHLALGPNVIMKFFLDGRINVDAGGALTTSSGVAFTCIKDDTLGGDTNDDNGALAPSDTDWIGIIVDGTCRNGADELWHTCE